MTQVALYEPKTVDEALHHLREDGALCLAGGQTLLAMMNANLVRPTALVSLAHISELVGISTTRHSVRIGAFTQHYLIASEEQLRDGNKALRESAVSIASTAIRNMGTMGGSVSLADPGADYPPVLVAVNAMIEIASAHGKRRQVSAKDFFVDWYTTVLEPGELVTAVTVPIAKKGSLGFYEKLSRVEGDYATASVAGVIKLDRKGRCQTIKLVVGACGPVPINVAEAEAVLIGSSLGDTVVSAAAKQIAAACDPVDDVRGSSEYRRQVIPILIKRGLTRIIAGGTRRR